MVAPREDSGPELFPSPAPPSVEGLDLSTAETYMAFQRVIDLHYSLVVKHLTERGSSPAQVILLRTLTVEDGTAQRDLAEALHLSRARVTRLVQALEADGMIRRVRDPEDQRIVRVYLTETGRAREVEKSAIREASLRRIFGKLAEDERKELSRLLGLVTVGIEESLQSDYGK